jgi:hypothetical protein
MHPSFDQFVVALRDPAQRAGIGLSISDDDASTLLTNANWANDYYARWIALFPPAVVAPAAVAPAFTPPAPPAPAPSPFGPPPTAVATQAPAVAMADTPAPNPRRRLPAPARIAIITVLGLVALSIVAGLIGEVAAVTRTPTAAKTHAAVTPASPGASAGVQNDPVVFHGLRQTEYNLLEAVLAPQGHSLEEAVSQGADDAHLQLLATNALSAMAKTCTDGEALDQGFDNAAFRASFIAAYESAQKSTSAQATKVYDTLAAYCAAH